MTAMLASESVLADAVNTAVETDAVAARFLDALAPLLPGHLTGNPRECLQDALVDLIDLRLSAAGLR